ncbi:hypothetical protein U9M48_010470 [Paspalum notatum var. saurae]|uniref:Uncharacterized protein n=1 Tax=Paspalum notatum var. saurae TaxID=547442 RepID=A0AAQ3SUU9_PASNO
MASMKLLSLTCILIVTGLVVLSETGGAAPAPERCPIVCIQGGFITCNNYPYQELDGCVCECAPKDGINCVLHLLATGDTVHSHVRTGNVHHVRQLPRQELHRVRLRRVRATRLRGLRRLMILGAVVEPSEAICNLACVRGAYITCSNYPGEQLYGCACKCAPPDGKRCVVHLGDGSAKRWA